MNSALLQQFEETFGVKIEKYEDKDYKIENTDYYSIGIGFYTQDKRTFRGIYDKDIEKALIVVMRYQLKELGMLGSGHYKDYWKMLKHTQYYNDLTVTPEEYSCKTEAKAKKAFFDDWSKNMIKDLLDIEIKKDMFNYKSYISTIQHYDCFNYFGDYDSVYDEARDAFICVFEV